MIVIAIVFPTAARDPLKAILAPFSTVILANAIPGAKVKVPPVTVTGVEIST